ncbi:MAG: zinc dependent phospholipase C family protein [Saprospiraceae bacterium]|nr:zinc dependent phospholipase C family protein [Saprospiraceae bacterium]
MKKESNNSSSLIPKIILGAVITLLGLTSFISSPDWGFFGHRKINRMAVFTLPPEMIQFYKKNIEYVTEHAVDPDKRRYASKHEAVRHYIDIDSWGDNPFYDVPRIFEDALIKYGNYTFGTGNRTREAKLVYTRDSIQITTRSIALTCPTESLRKFFRDSIMPDYYEGVWKIKNKDLKRLFPDLQSKGDLSIQDGFSKEGILPYHMNQMFYWLVKAFEDQNAESILRISAEFGHYIGDAHVPLHTTKNYNGQLTDQVGIHAFWESRLPELYADDSYSYLVGKADYVEKPLTYFWKMIKDSHDLLEDVLVIEKELTQTFPEDQQMCYDERLERTIKTQCPEFAYAYHEGLNGMVEARMQDAILAIGSVWYSAWIEAGQPDLENLKQVEVEEVEIKVDPSISTRDHNF